MRQYPNAFPHLMAISFPLLFLIGPTIWVYTNKLSNDNHDWSLFHFIPVAVVFLIFSDFYFQSAEYKLEWLDEAREVGLPLKYNIVWTAACLHIFWYFYQVLKKLRAYQSFLENCHSNLARVNLKWITFFSSTNSILWLSYLVVFILFQLNILSDPYGIIDKLFALGQGILIYGIGYHVLSKPEVFREYNPAKIEKSDEAKYEKTGLTEQKVQERLAGLMDLMEKERPYLNPDLTLNDLAKLVDTSPRQLSQIINQGLGKKFYEFVNEFRVEESKKLLEEGELKMLGVAYDSGFKSKSTFNEAFKRFAGLTPSEYLKRKVMRQSAIKF